MTQTTSVVCLLSGPIQSIHKPNLKPPLSLLYYTLLTNNFNLK